MTWTKYTTRYLRKTWQADVLGALGKACQLVALGMVFGAVVGTWPFVAGTLLAIGGTGAAGVACMIGANALRECAENLPEAQESRRVDQAASNANAAEMETTLVPEHQFVEFLERQRGHSVGIARLM
jgi:hypothetical protein